MKFTFLKMLIALFSQHILNTFFTLQNDLIKLLKLITYDQFFILKTG